LATPSLLLSSVTKSANSFKTGSVFPIATLVWHSLNLEISLWLSPIAILFSLEILNISQKYFTALPLDELEDKVSELQKIVDYFKGLWKKFIKFLQNKFFSNDKYDDFINDLYEEDILDENDIDIMQNNSKN